MRKQALIIWTLAVPAPMLVGYLNSVHAGPYVQGWAGASFWRDCSNSDEVEASCEAEPTGGVAAGYQWYWVAVEAEVSGRRATTHNVKDTSGLPPEAGGIGRGDEQGYVLTGMVNVWPVIQLAANWQLYGGGGVGLGYARLAGESDTALAWQVGGGIQYALTEALSVDMGYRYLVVEDTEHQGLTAEYDSHNVQIGLRYEF